MEITADNLPKFFNSTISISTSLNLLFWIMMLMSIFISIFVTYHWFRYEGLKSKVFHVVIVNIGVVIFLLTVAFVAMEKIPT